MNKTYWVLSDGEKPIRMFFLEDEAKQCAEHIGADFIDVFDDDGEVVQSIKFVNDVWTEEF